MGKKDNLADVLFSLLVQLPSWFGPILAGVSYLLVRYLIPGMLEGDGTNPFAQLARGIAPVVPILVLAVWLAAEIKKWTDRRRLDKTKDVDDIRAMSWRQFERLVGEAYRRQGYTIQETGSAAGDGGIDLTLERGGQRTLVQCKNWRKRRVGVEVVRELRGAMADAGAADGQVVCSGTFTPAARDFAERNGVELVGGDTLMRMIKDVQRTSTGSEPRQPELASVPSEPPVAPIKADTPSCPRCGSAMVLRTARRGAHRGEQFWGCPRFPACRGTRRIDG